MRYALISDIHSNLEALTAVCAVLDAQKVDQTYCLGDLVGYGPQPNEVVAEIQRRCGTHVILGNHDIAVLKPDERNYMNEHAAAAISYTIDVLTHESASYLASLPSMLVTPDMHLFHGDYPDNPFDYIIGSVDAGETLGKIRTSTTPYTVAFFGHTHVPALYHLNAQGRFSAPPLPFPFPASYTVTLPSQSTVLVNVGSVGQPRDRDNRACFVIYDTDKREITWHRVAYDIPTTQAKIRECKGVTRHTADRLEGGY